MQFFKERYRKSQKSPKYWKRNLLKAQNNKLKVPNCKNKSIKCNAKRNNRRYLQLILYLWKTQSLSRNKWSKCAKQWAWDVIERETFEPNRFILRRRFKIKHSSTLLRKSSINHLKRRIINEHFNLKPKLINVILKIIYSCRNHT